MSKLPESEPLLEQTKIEPNYKDENLHPFPQAAYLNIKGVEGITGTITVRIRDDRIKHVNDNMKNAVEAINEAGFPVEKAVVGADRDVVKDLTSIHDVVEE